MELTEHETQIILKLRRQSALEARRREISVHLLQTAAAYRAWLVDNDNGDTYSTFCDDFEYVNQLDLDRPWVHAQVMALAGAAARATSDRILS
jgi:hypothetical protein